MEEGSPSSRRAPPPSTTGTEAAANGAAGYLGFCGTPLDWLLDWAHTMWVGALGGTSPSVLYTSNRASDARSAGGGLCTLYARADLPPQPAGAIRVVCLSDTHESHQKVAVPDGDVLVLAGDFLTLNAAMSLSYSRAKLRRLAMWIHALPHAHKIVVAGNHDSACEELGAEWMRSMFNRNGAVYLEDDGVALDAGDLQVWGSPYNRNNHPDARVQSPNIAFQSNAAQRLARAQVGADILVTHGPLFTADLDRLRPRLYVCGHVHELHGVQQSGTTLCVNACVMDKAYQPTHAPIVCDLFATSTDVRIGSGGGESRTI